MAFSNRLHTGNAPREIATSQHDWYPNNQELKRGDTSPIEKGKRERQVPTSQQLQQQQQQQQQAQTMQLNTIPASSGFPISNIKEAIGKFKSSPYYSSVVNQQNQKKYQQQLQVHSWQSGQSGQIFPEPLKGINKQQHIQQISRIYQNNQVSVLKPSHQLGGSALSKKNSGLDPYSNKFTIGGIPQRNSLKLPQRPSTSNDATSMQRKQYQLNGGRVSYGNEQMSLTNTEGFNFRKPTTANASTRYERANKLLNPNVPFHPLTMKPQVQQYQQQQQFNQLPSRNRSAGVNSKRIDGNRGDFPTQSQVVDDFDDHREINGYQGQTYYSMVQNSQDNRDAKDYSNQIFVKDAFPQRTYCGKQQKKDPPRKCKQESQPIRCTQVIDEFSDDQDGPKIIVTGNEQQKTHKIKAVENSFTKDEHGEEGEEELEEDLDDILQSNHVRQDEEQRRQQQKRREQFEYDEGDDERDEDDQEEEEYHYAQSDEDDAKYRKEYKQYAVPFDEDDEENEQDQRDDEDGEEDDDNNHGEEDEEEEEEEDQQKYAQYDDNSSRQFEGFQYKRNEKHDEDSSDGDEIYKIEQDDEDVEQDQEEEEEEETLGETQIHKYMQEKMKTQNHPNNTKGLLSKANRPMTTEGGRRMRPRDAKIQSRKQEDVEYKTKEVDVQEPSKENTEQAQVMNEFDDEFFHNDLFGQEFKIDFDTRQFERPPARGKVIHGGPVKVDHDLMRENTILKDQFQGKRPPSRHRIPNRAAGLGIPIQELQEIPIKNMYEKTEAPFAETNCRFFDSGKFKIEKKRQMDNSLCSKLVKQSVDNEDAFLTFDFKNFGESRKNSSKKPITELSSTKSYSERPQSGNLKSRIINKRESIAPEKPLPEKVNQNNIQNLRLVNHPVTTSHSQTKNSIHTKENDSSLWDDFDDLLNDKQQLPLKSFVRRLEGSDILIKHNISSTLHPKSSKNSVQAVKLPFETSLGQDFLSLFANN